MLTTNAINSTVTNSTKQAVGAIIPNELPGILPHHLAELRRSGLADETIRAAGVYSETSPAKLAALLDWKKCSRSRCERV